MFIKLPHFKMEDIRSAKNLLIPKAFMATIDLKDAYFLISVRDSNRKYLRFLFNGKTYQFTCLPFGLCTSPYIFTKILKPVLNKLRQEGFMSIVYLDDFLCFGNTYNACQENVNRTLDLLKSLGFVVNLRKSQLRPSQRCKYLGFILNAENYTLELTDTKKEKILETIKKFHAGKSYTIREVAQLLGILTASCPAVAYGTVKD